ncbi:MAG UNVERIFIED_CONTAM: hypothetical protein LVT10_16410 [Anaerolineae bacterium]|jgi:hypothetical protein
MATGHAVFFLMSGAARRHPEGNANHPLEDFAVKHLNRSDLRPLAPPKMEACRRSKRELDEWLDRFGEDQPVPSDRHSF